MRASSRLPARILRARILAAPRLASLRYGLVLGALCLPAGIAAAAGASSPVPPVAAPAGKSPAPSPASSPATVPTGYVLGPLDRIRLRVFEWRASRDEIFAWTALNDEFTIGADGTLSLPIIGDVPAAGLPTREVGRLVAKRLRDRMELADAPDTAVEIAQYRPFYITGAVDKPGEYFFRPGLTVGKAVALAGGPPRVADSGLLRLERDAIAARGDLAGLQKDRDQLAIRLVRLAAERDDKPKVEFPKDLAGRPDPGLQALMERETSIFEARRKALAAQVDAIEDLKRFLRQQIDALNGQLATIDTQIKLIATEIRSNEQLAERGLATQQRTIAAGRSMAQMESEKLRTTTDLLRARESISRADITILDMRSKRATEVTGEMRDTQRALEQLKPRMEMAERLIIEAEVSAPRFLSDRVQARRARPTYRIARQSGPTTQEIGAEENTALMPGDAVTVELPNGDLPAVSWPSATRPGGAMTSLN
ncbi:MULTISPECIES: polysaccharide biosynthesis/export family protein [Methylobacterium]|uniref:polysaccharide biosynthesis/export family protein n=1 Tax=Methylobacterium TaxID=407 RepID=UPI0013ED5251|nr:polysaccharide biosynthesis/export family protein [Methylobacterium sp. DB0501]NGM37623.1 sugar ABC transporter substrate-binding protein [Methylobacterium sp. DB0501]